MTRNEYEFVRDRTVDEIGMTLARVEPAEAIGLAEGVLSAERVFVSGAGRSGLAIRACAMRLMHLGLVVHVVGETTTPAIARGDLLIAASASGRTAGTLNAAEAAKRAGARVAAITAQRGSPLATACDLLVILPAATSKTAAGTSDELVRSSQPMGNLFEQLLWLFGDLITSLLRSQLGRSDEQMMSSHANLE